MYVSNLSEVKRSSLLLIVLGICGTPLIIILLIEAGFQGFIGLFASLGLLFVVRYPRLGLYLMLFLVPIQNLVVLESGNTVIRIVGLVTITVWIAIKLLNKETVRPVFQNPIVTPMLVFALLAGISVLWSDLSAWQGAMLTIIQLIVWVVMLLDLIDTLKRLKIAILALFLGCMISAGNIVNEYVGNPDTWTLWSRAGGGFDDPNFSSSTFLVILPFVLLVTRKKSGILRLVALIASGILLLAIGISVSRTALLLTIVLLFFDFIMVPQLNTKLKFFAVILILLLIVIMLVPWQNVIYRFSIAWTGDKTTDLNSRLFHYKNAWLFFLEDPLLGRGLGRLKSQFDVVHNAFLEILGELGLLGLLTFTWIWVAAIYCLRGGQKMIAKIDNLEMKSILSATRLSFLIYLLFSLTVSNERTRMLWLMFALAGVCYQIAKDLDEERISTLRDKAVEDISDSC